MPDKPTCVVHIDEDGNEDFLICGNARMLVIDERTPGDRVYATTLRISADGLAKLIGDSGIGSAHDDRHEAIRAVVLASLEGKRSHLSVVE